MARRHRASLLAGALLFAAACGDDPPANPLPPPRAPAAAPGAPGTAVGALHAPVTDRSALLEEVRKGTLTKEDFTETDTNRDPFRSYLSSFAVQVVINKQHKIVLEKFALDELKLIAIISGEAASPRAMFVDPGGMGVAVLRGDHVSKADATVTRIAPDRVFFRIEEDVGTDKPKITERVIELHAGEAVAQ